LECSWGRILELSCKGEPSRCLHTWCHIRNEFEKAKAKQNPYPALDYNCPQPPLRRPELTPPSPALGPPTTEWKAQIETLRERLKNETPEQKRARETRMRQEHDRMRRVRESKDDFERER
jgi:hypothetical protein